MQPAKEQLAYLMRGIDTVLPEGALLTRLEEGRPQRVKLGVDPTAPDVTLGWAVVFDLLRRFQDLGHIAVLIIGDFTAQVGDPSAKSETRKRLGADEVGDYASSVMGSIRKLLSAENLEIRHNSEWLSTLAMDDVLDLTAKFTVARIMDREDFTKRWDRNQPISMIEFMYPLLQARDSVAVEADIEIGGSDQLWNLLVGRELQERSGQPPQLVMTVPLLVGTDGVRKMSQSLGNYISVNDEPNEMFGKVMSVPDDAMCEWFVLAAGWQEEDADRLVAEIQAGDRHPGETKRLLAREVVAKYSSEHAAVAAESAFDRVFRDKQTPQDVSPHVLPDDESVWLPGLIQEAGLASSNGEARRLISQGAVKLDGEKVETEELPRTDLVGRVLQVGKRRYAKLVASP